jgi:type I restriction enzyme S subunit
MNATLEAMARALFHSWFVDFDPVHAKAAGHQPTGMDAVTAALFPASFLETEIGVIPSQWRYLEAQEVAQIGIGKTPPRKEPQWFSENPDDVPWVSIRDMGSSGVFIQQTSEFLTEEAVSRFNVRRVPRNTVLLSFKLTVGRVVIADMPLTTNEAIAHFSLNSECGLSPELLHLYLLQFNYDSLGSTSSIATAVNSATIRAMPILVPPKELIRAFTKLVSPLYEKIRANQSESRSLSETRDSLLPRLLNGEISPLRAV